MQQFLVSHNYSTCCVQLSQPSVPLLSQAVLALTGIPLENQRLLCNGRELHNDSQLCDGHPFTTIDVQMRLPGGKGGFGSLLRSSKSTKKTTNFGACRSLDGRRLRDVQQEQRQAEAEQRRAQMEREAQDQKKEEPAPEPSAVELAQEKKARQTEKIRKEIAENLETSVKEGLVAAQKQKEVEKKRKLEETTLSNDMWGDLLSDEEELSDNDKEPETKKQKTEQ